MISIFATCKPFTDQQHAVAQRNALTSWTLLEPRPEIILLGDDPGTEEIAIELQLIHIPALRRGESNRPFIKEMWTTAHTISTYDVLVSVNSDIILGQDFIRAVQAVASRFHLFLMVGQRHDLDVDIPLTFSDGWEVALHQQVTQRGKLHAPCGKDYFAFRRGVYDVQLIPDFQAGIIGWDNWALHDAISRGIPTIDATNAVCAIHQNHPQISNLVGGVERSLKLFTHAGKYYQTTDAPWVLDTSLNIKPRC